MRRALAARALVERPKGVRGRGGRHVHLALSVRPGQRDQLVRELAQRGVHHEGPVEYDGGDRSVYFKDSEGTVVEAWDFFEQGEGGRDGVDALLDRRGRHVSLLVSHAATRGICRERGGPTPARGA